ncbi:MAG: SpoIIE family protein phosphatase [Flavobacteriales bacterium]|nr:SpoIIE family protein phosphatase [Flavobacteriales bacterium]
MLESTTKYLLQTQEEVREKSKLLEARNKEMFDSISYARFVQDGLIEHEDYLKDVFADSFIWLNQVEAIGGDLPYVRKVGDEVVIAAIDCTGHGVAGAMLTAMVHSLLNDLVSSQLDNPSGILEGLNRYFIETFDQEGRHVFGFDIGLVVYNTATKTLRYVGAGRPMLFVRDGEVERISKAGLGIGVSAISEFDEYVIQVLKGDQFYLFSDGISDQLGDAIPKKYSEKRLRELLLDVRFLRMNKQKEVVRDFLYAWQGDQPQTDDQLLIGFKPF